MPFQISLQNTKLTSPELTENDHFCQIFVVIVNYFPHTIFDALKTPGKIPGENHYQSARRTQDISLFTPCSA